ncbi:MAG: ABC transporter permease [Actinomycetota bacterium]|jgi:ABC-type nitrate/sulfonate/bicarbonate transport system permease component|nr:MAG: ABC transporter permease [Actinomycetota bacterium]
MSGRWQRTLAPVAFGIGVVSAWQVGTAVFDADPRILPSPLDVLAAIAKDPGVLARNAWTTIVEMVLGFVVGASIGLVLGVALAYSRIVRTSVYPWLVVSQTIPIPAIAAVLVIWFGFSILPKVLVVALITFFPVAVSTTDGLNAVDPDLVRLMRALGASKLQVFREVRIPAALPHVFTGMKVAAAFAVLGAVFGEWVGARGGLGYLLLLQNRAVNTDVVFAVIFILSLLGVGFFGLVALVERLTIPWYHRQRKDQR